MLEKRFKQDLFAGRGSALLELQSCEKPEKYREIVRYACLHNTMCDAQSEGDRSWYLYRAMQLADKEGGIGQALIQKFRAGTLDYWLFTQLAAILCCCAEAGEESTRAALYAKYAELLSLLSRKRKFDGRCRKADIFWGLCVQLTSLDGWGGFKAITRDIAEKLLPKNADYFFDEWFYVNAQGKFGKKRVNSYLEKQAGKSFCMCAYYKKAIGQNACAPPERPAPPALAQVLRETDGKNNTRALALRFVNGAGKADLEKLAQEAINEPDIKRKCELLWGFRNGKFPFSEEVLLNWARSGHAELREAAVEILANTPSLKARHYALFLLESKTDILNGVILLCKNYRVKDEPLLLSALRGIKRNYRADSFHWAAMDACEAVASAGKAPTTNILVYLYYNMPCSFCRYPIVRLLHKTGGLPSAVLQECLFDANCDVRDFAAAVSKAKEKTGGNLYAF